MRHLTIGTAGHVDHGKTRLTAALTGTDTDRWAEEKRRGVTIDIGFARMTLPGNLTVSIVDVPGHERFIRNMLAGATGVDAVLMTVAADDGVMPQTLEHLGILELLGIREGVIVITKKDLADEEWLRAVEEEIREKVKGSFLENAPVCAVSAVTGEGLEELRGEIAALAERIPEKPEKRPFRLPVDRVFTLGGSGVIVTGTVAEGTLETGQSVMLFPGEKTVRIRELQSHGESVPRVSAGMRAAAALSGAGKEEIGRGSVLAEPGSIRTAGNLTASLRLLKDSPFSVRNSSRLHLYTGTQELLCKVRLLDRDELLPGEECFTQLFFEGDGAAVRIADRFVVRFFSPVVTVGGGTVLETDTKRAKRNRPELLDRLEALLTSRDERVYDAVLNAGSGLIGEGALSLLLGLSSEEAAASAACLLEQGRILDTGSGYAAAPVYERIREKAAAVLADYHGREPLSEGMPLGEFREKVFGGEAGSRGGEIFLGMLRADGALRLRGNTVSAGDFQVTLPPETEACRSGILRDFRGYGFMPPPLSEYEKQHEGRGTQLPKLLRLMKERGELVDLGRGYVMDAETLHLARSRLAGMFERQGPVTLGQYRTELGISRKYASLILEYFDGQKLTKLEGEARVPLRGFSSGS